MCKIKTRINQSKGGENKAMTGKEKFKKILDMRYKEHKPPSEIAKEVGVSRPYITKVIKTDKRYFNERENQKMETKKNKAEAEIIIYEKKEIDRIENYKMDRQHNIDAAKLSLIPKLSNRKMARCNRSAYDYDPNSSDLVIREDITASYVMPDRVSNVVNADSII